MSKFRILLDMDGVVVDLLRKWCSVYNEAFHDKMTVEEFGADWDLSKSAKCGDNVWDIYKEPGFFEDLPFVGGAAAGVLALQRDKRNELFLVSAFDGNAEIVHGKVIWIQKYLPFINKKQIVFTNSKYLIGGDCLIDDKPKHLENWDNYDKVGARILFDAPHNRGCKEFIRARNWEELMVMIEAARKLVKGE